MACGEIWGDEGGVIDEEEVVDEGDWARDLRRGFGLRGFSDLSGLRRRSFGSGEVGSGSWSAGSRWWW